MSKLTQQQKTEQTLSLTPAQIQAIKILELTGLELTSRIEHELEENPALEEDYEQPTLETSSEEGENDTNDQDWELGEYASEDDIPEYKLRELQERQSVREEIPFASGAPSLDEQLMSQLSLVTPLTDRRREVARYIKMTCSSRRGLMSLLMNSPSLSASSKPWIPQALLPMIYRKPSSYRLSVYHQMS